MQKKQLKPFTEDLSLQENWILFSDYYNKNKGNNPAFGYHVPDIRTSIKDGDTLCFFSKEYAIVQDYNPPSILCRVENGQENKNLFCPLNLLYFEYAGDELKPSSLVDDINRIDKMLGRCWVAHKKILKQKKRGLYGLDYQADITVYILSETDASTISKWIYQEDQIMMDIEINMITRSHRLRAEANTTSKETLLSTDEGPRRTSSRFTWGEGYDEWDVWDVTERWQKDTYYKGILVSSEIITRTHEENNR